MNKNNGKNNSLRTGFEPVRVTPSDFESDALTTRPSQLVPISQSKRIVMSIQPMMHETVRSYMKLSDTDDPSKRPRNFSNSDLSSNKVGMDVSRLTERPARSGVLKSSLESDKHLKDPKSDFWPLDLEDK